MQGKDLECLAGTRSRRGCHAGVLELYVRGNEERHVQICILQGSLRQHHENELEGPKPAVGDMVCRRLYSNLQKEEQRPDLMLWCSGQ